MKGTFFQKPHEFQLQVTGEAWNQGDAVSGTLSSREHSGSASQVEAAVHLAHGDLKKLRQKSADAFRVVESIRGKAGTLEWRFQLSRNAPVTDAGSSLFLLYGIGDQYASLGQLQLNVLPEPLIQQFIGVLEIEFRFSVKTKKSQKDRVEIKLAPPQGKAFALVENLVLRFRFEGETLHVDYVFQVKKLEATSTGMGASKQKRETSQVLSPGQHFYPGRLNQEAAEKLIREALALVESKILF